MAKRRKRQKSSGASNARRRAAEHRSDGGSTVIKLPQGVEFYSPKKGKALVDILNYPVGAGNPWAEEGSLHYERTYFMHRYIGAENGKYICPRATINKPCPICEYRSKLLSENGNKDVIKSLKPQERQLFNVIDLSEGGNIVRVLDMAHFSFGKQLDGEINDSDEEEGYGQFGDLKDGFTLRLGIDEEPGDGYKYLKVNRVAFKTRKKEYDESILDELVCLDDTLDILSYKELKKIFLQTEDLDDDDDDEDDEEVSSKRKKKIAKKKATVDDDLEDDDNDDDLEDVDDDVVDDLEDDDDDEDDEDDDDLEDDDDDDDMEDDDGDDDDDDWYDMEDDDDDLDDDDDDEEPAPKKKAKKKTAKKKATKKKTAKKTAKKKTTKKRRG